MKLCLGCKALSPGESLHCVRCSGTFGCRLCDKKKHVAPMSALRCPTCGTDRLSTPVFFLPLGWLVRLLSWCVMGGLVYALFLFARGMGHNARIPPAGSHWARCLESCLFSWCAALLVLWVLWIVVLDLLPSDLAKPLRTVAKTLGRFGWTLLVGAARLMWGVLRLGAFVVEGESASRQKKT